MKVKGTVWEEENQCGGWWRIIITMKYITKYNDRQLGKWHNEPIFIKSQFCHEKWNDFCHVNTADFSHDICKMKLT